MGHDREELLLLHLTKAKGKRDDLPKAVEVGKGRAAAEILAPWLQDYFSYHCSKAPCWPLSEFLIGDYRDPTGWATVSLGIQELRGRVASASLLVE